MRRWRIIEWPERPSVTKDIEFTCAEGCWEEALLPVNIDCVLEAQVGLGVVWDPHAERPNLPSVIECPHCRRRFTTP